MNGEMMRLCVERGFTPAREESMARNLEEARLAHEQVQVQREGDSVVVDGEEGQGYTGGVEWTEEDVARHAEGGDGDDAAAGTNVVVEDVDAAGWDTPSTSLSTSCNCIRRGET